MIVIHFSHSILIIYVFFFIFYFFFFGKKHFKKGETMKGRKNGQKNSKFKSRRLTVWPLHFRPLERSRIFCIICLFFFFFNINIILSYSLEKYERINQAFRLQETNKNTGAGDRFQLPSTIPKWLSLSLSLSLSRIHPIPSLQTHRTPIMRIQSPITAPPTLLPIPSLTLATLFRRRCRRIGLPSPWAPNPNIHIRLHLKLSRTARLVLRSLREMPLLCRMMRIRMFLQLRPREILLLLRVSQVLLSVLELMKFLFIGCACLMND